MCSPRYKRPRHRPVLTQYCRGPPAATQSHRKLPQSDRMGPRVIAALLLISVLVITMQGTEACLNGPTTGTFNDDRRKRSAPNPKMNALFEESELEMSAEELPMKK